ncbi:hypothetical protein T484DRAFT_1981775 [Baffinella frigidus]|nr:hypothetical protein T484DRAFT_1981775 [Cryptophyta sp. CCMP2293]
MRASCSAHRETPGLKLSARSTDNLPRRYAPWRFDGRRNGGDLGDETRNAGRGTTASSGLRRAPGADSPPLSNEPRYGQERTKSLLERSALLSAHRRRKLVAGPGGMQELFWRTSSPP